MTSADISGLVFHETGHASHYSKAGGDFWAKLINYEITCWANEGNVYSTGVGANYGIAAIAEAWGHHIGWYLLKEKYSTNPHMSNSLQENFTPEERGDDSTSIMRYSAYTSGKLVNCWGWIPAGIMYDLIDDNADVVWGSYPDYIYDNAEGYTNQKIFNALDDDVESMSAFETNLLDENNNLDEDDVIDLFDTYYF